MAKNPYLGSIIKSKKDVIQVNVLHVRCTPLSERTLELYCAENSLSEFYGM